MAMSTGKVVALIQAMGGADPAVIEAKVEEWLDAHPEATTTVQDGSITEQKLATSIAQKLGLISSLSDEIDGIDSDVTDLKSALSAEIQKVNDGYNFNPDDFVRGQIENGAEGTYYQDRIKFASIKNSGNAPIHLSTAPGYSVRIVVYDENNTYDHTINYRNSYILKENTNYKVVIRDDSHTDTDHNTPANIQLMATKLFFESVKLDYGDTTSTLLDYAMEAGILGSRGENVDDEYNRARKMRTVGYILAHKGDTVELNDDTLRFLVARYDMNKSFVGSSGWVTDSFTVTENEYIRIQFGLKSDSALNDYITGTYRASIKIHKNLVDIINEITVETNVLNDWKTSSDNGKIIFRPFSYFEFEWGMLNADGSDNDDEYNYYRKRRSVESLYLNKGDILTVEGTGIRAFCIATKVYGKYGNVTSGWITASQPYTILYSGYYRIQYGSSGDGIISEAVIDTYERQINLKSNILSGDAELYEYISKGVPESGEFSYNGSRINTAVKHYYTFKELPNLPALPENVSRQASAYYSGILFKLYSYNKIHLLNYETSEIIALIDAPVEHANCADFSNEFDDEQDEFPLLYVGTDNANNDIVVIKVTRSSATLKRTIRIPVQTAGYHASNFGIEKESNTLWTTGYVRDDYQTAENNGINLCAWDLNSLADNGDGSVTPAFMGKWSLPFIDTTQDEKILNGQLFVISSNPYASAARPSKIYVISLDGKRITNILTDMWEKMKEKEIEGIVFVERNEKYVMQLDNNYPGDRVEIEF